MDDNGGEGDGGQGGADGDECDLPAGHAGLGDDVGGCGRRPGVALGGGTRMAKAAGAAARTAERASRIPVRTVVVLRSLLMVIPFVGEFRPGCRCAVQLALCCLQRR